MADAPFALPGGPLRLTQIPLDNRGILDVCLHLDRVCALAPPIFRTPGHEAEMMDYLTGVLRGVQDVLRDVQPGTTLAHYDSVTVRYYPPDPEEDTLMRHFYERRAKLLPLSGEDLLAFVNFPPLAGQQARGVDNRAALAAWYERVTGRLAEPLPVDVESRGLFADTRRGILLWGFEHASWPIVPVGAEMPMLALLPHADLQRAFPVQIAGRNVIRLAVGEDVASLWETRFGPDEPAGAEHVTEGHGAPYDRSWYTYGLRISTRVGDDDVPATALSPLPPDAVCLSVQTSWARQQVEAIFYHPDFPAVAFGAEIPEVGVYLDWANRPTTVITTAAEWNQERRRW